jgi:hypothetical protein
LAPVTDQNDPTEPASPTPGAHRPTGSIRPKPVQYKGQPLEPDRGPGLGCFRFQLVLLVALILITPLSVGKVPDVVTAALLFVTLALLLVSGQTIIFLLRLVAADRRGRRQPLAPRSPTVGQLEEEPVASTAAPTTDTESAAATPEREPRESGPPGTGPVRQ